MADPREPRFPVTTPDQNSSSTDPETRSGRAGDGGRLLRVLFFNHEYWPTLGGVQTLTRNLARALRERGHTVAIVANHSDRGQPQTSEVEGLVLRRFPFSAMLESRDPQGIAILAAEIDALKQEFRPDIVHVNFPAASAFFHLQSMRPDQTTVVLFHAALDGWRDIWPLARSVAGRADVLVVPSRFLAGNIAPVLSRTPDQFSVIEHGIPEGRLLAIGPLPDGPPARFLFAGRLQRLKGPQVAIDAAVELARRGIAAELDLAGTGQLTDPFLKWREELKLSERFVLLGRLSDEEVAGRLADAAALVVPSLSKESFSLVSAEAALAGRPVLASRRGALPETVVDGETGLLFEPDNAAALADVMQRVLTEPGLAARLGAAARKRALSRYRLSSMVDRYEALYRGVAKG